MRQSRTLILIALLLFTAAAPAAAQSPSLCFPETNQCLADPILAWWRAAGGLASIGLPLTPLRDEPVEGLPSRVQWFERTRAELNADGSVRLGRIGADLLAAQGRDWRDFPASAPQPDCQHFPATGHQLCGLLLRTWQASGGITSLGMPLSGPRAEQLGDGRTYDVQWLERGRLELHPDLSPPYDVQLGRLGAEIMAAPPAPLGLTARDGRLAFESSAGLDLGLFPGADPARASFIHVASAAGAERTAITRSHAQRDEAPVWSPDGTQIAFHSPRAGGLPDISVVDADGANLTRLTSHPAADGFPSWSPDGTHIAFASERDGNWEIYVMAADGSGQTNISRRPGSTDTQPAWSPDGSRIAFRSTVFGHDDEILTMAPDGSDVTNLSRSPDSHEDAPAWSPDGSQIAFESNRDGNREIYLMAADGSGQTNLSHSSGDDYAPAWSPDGAKIAFESDRDGNREVYLMRRDGSDPTNLSRSPLSDERHPSWAPTPAIAADPCADVPEPISARVSPSRCPHANEAVTLHVFGFLAGARFEYRVTDPHGVRSPPLAGGHVNAHGELTGIQFPAHTLTPGRWHFAFTFFTEGASLHAASVDLRIAP